MVKPLLCFLGIAAAVTAQSTASLHGRALDPTGGSVSGMQIQLAAPLTGFVRDTVSNTEGEFSFTNLPLQSYTLRATAAGFTVWEQVLSLRTNIAAEIMIELRVAGDSTSVNVSAAARERVDPEETGTRNQMNAAEIARLVTGPGTRGLEAVLVGFPGFAKSANGAIHPRGAHNQMSYIVDGMPIQDQLTGAFANAVDPNIAQTVELYTGNIAAEYGGKVGAVVNVTTRSGLGTGSRLRGSTLVEAAQFDTLTQVTQLSGESGRVGYTASVNTARSHRFLDQVSLDNFHNGGNSERGFTRLDWLATPRNVFRLTAMSGRSSFELANLRSQRASGQDQRQALRDVSVSLGWLHTLSPRATVDVTASYRATIAELFSSPGDTPVTASQARHLTTANFAGRYNRVAGSHVFRIGADVQRFPVSEDFRVGITSPDFNIPGTPRYNPNLAPIDLTRGGSLFQFSAKQTGGLYSGFAQDGVSWGRLRLTLGLRYDNYRFRIAGNQLQPRVGLAFHVRETGTVLRLSYNRNYQTPPNENLLLSDSPAAAALAPPGVRQTFGGVPVRIRAERQDVYEGGLQQAFGRRFSLNASVYHKSSRDQQDNNNFLNTGIIFPISLARIRVNGAEARVQMLEWRGFTGSLSFTHSRAVSTPPFTGGVFLGDEAVAALSQGAFLIDHDQKLSIQGNIQYTSVKGWWTSYTVRHDSGLVANPSDPAQVAADPDYSDLLPYVNLKGATSRVTPRTVSDIAAGYRHGDGGRHDWEISMNVVNLMDKTALYNFQSIFVGTRVIAPRTVGARFRWFW